VFVPRFAEGDFNRLPQLVEVNMSAARALGLTVPPYSPPSSG
jgi:hypothetical protein